MSLTIQSLDVDRFRIPRAALAQLPA